MESAPPDTEAETPEYSEVEATREATTLDFFQIVMATLVALVALIGAVASCGLDKNLDDAGDADAAGVTALINFSDAQTRATLRGLENYRAFTFYKRYQAEADALTAELTSRPHPAAERSALIEELTDAETSAQSYQTNLSRYLSPGTGTGYDIDRDIGEDIASQSAQKDFSFDDYFSTSDKLRSEGQRLLKMPLILAVSVVLLAAAEGGEGKLRYVFAAVAFVIATFSTVVIVLG